MNVKRVLGNLGLPDTPAGRRAYQEQMEEFVAEVRAQRGRAVRKEIDEVWKELQNDWCFGDADFRDRMLELMERVLKEKGKAGYDGGSVREHNERQAEALIQRALDDLELAPEQLNGLRKTDPRKQAIAWLVRRQTAVRNHWVSDRLMMGHEVNVSQSVRRVADATSGELRNLRTQLEKILNSKV